MISMQHLNGTRICWNARMNCLEFGDQRSKVKGQGYDGFTKVLTLWTLYFSGALKELLICHKCPLELGDELIRLWQSNANSQDHGDLRKNTSPHSTHEPLYLIWFKKNNWCNLKLIWAAKADNHKMVHLVYNIHSQTIMKYTSIND